MEPSKAAIEAAHEQIDYTWGYATSEGCKTQTEKALKAAYAIDFAALQKELERLKAENEELCKHQIPQGWICHP